MMGRVRVAATLALMTVGVSGCAGAELLKSGQLEARAACQAVVDATQTDDPAQASSDMERAVQKAAQAAAANPEYAGVDGSLTAMLMAVAVNDEVEFTSALEDLARACDAVDPDPDWSDVVKGFLS